jgi:hypothetical protein
MRRGPPPLQEGVWGFRTGSPLQDDEKSGPSKSWKRRFKSVSIYEVPMREYEHAFRCRFACSGVSKQPPERLRYEANGPLSSVGLD